MRDMDIVTLKDEEWEAINLADYRDLNHEEAAELMGISRPTFSRLISSARKAVASALVEGTALKIGGGDFQMVLKDETKDQNNNSKGTQMKIAFSTTGDNLSASVEQKFGRSPKFLVLDTENDDFEIIDNTSHDASGGAGVKAAEIVAKASVKIVITGDCGPKALNALKQADVSVYSIKNASIKDALDLYRAGKLPEIK